MLRLRQGGHALLEDPHGCKTVRGSLRRAPPGSCFGCSAEPRAEEAHRAAMHADSCTRLDFNQDFHSSGLICALMEVIRTIEDKVQDEYLTEKFAKSVAAAERTIDLYGCASRLHPAPPAAASLVNARADPPAVPTASMALHFRSTAARTPQCSCTFCARRWRGTSSAPPAKQRCQAAMESRKLQLPSRRCAQTAMPTAQNSHRRASMRRARKAFQTGWRLRLSQRMQYERTDWSPAHPRTQSRRMSRLDSIQRRAAAARRQV